MLDGPMVTDFVIAVDELHLEEPSHPATQKHTGYYQLEDWLMHDYANFKTGVYTMVLGQCMGASRDKLKSHPDLTMELLSLK